MCDVSLNLEFWELLRGYINAMALRGGVAVIGWLVAFGYGLLQFVKHSHAKK